MSKVWHVPIEPIPMRYSAQWGMWFEERAQENEGFIWGDPITDIGVIREGEFLDVYKTHMYKAGQVKMISQMLQRGEIKDGDSLLFHDAWFPLEQVFYMLEAADKSVRTVGIFHAGAWDNHDFLHRKGMSPWARHVEEGWMAGLDSIIVFSEFHKKLLVERRNAYPGKIEVMPFPYDLSDLDVYLSKIDWSGREIEVVFPHRRAPEKSPWIIEVLREAGISVHVTADHPISKDAYYRILARSKFAVSWAKQETFGLAMMEAQYLGCCMVVPDRLAYREYYEPFQRVGSVEAMIRRIKEIKYPLVEGGPARRNMRRMCDTFGEVLKVARGESRG